MNDEQKARLWLEKDFWSDMIYRHKICNNPIPPDHDAALEDKIAENDTKLTGTEWVKINDEPSN